MPDERNINHGDEAAWLAQYYTASKSGDDLESGLRQDEPAPTDLLAAHPDEKYTMTGEVGIGGMKKVYRAHDRNADRSVALATLRKEAPSPSRERRFLREARITAALEHPNIVPIHEIGLDAMRRPYFTMKLLGGENLHDILKKLDDRDPAYRKQYPLARMLEIFQSVCNAVAFAHSRGVVHLDLKPANIQVGSFGEVLVLDWGLAKILERGNFNGTPIQLPEALREIPVEGAVRGTPGYMAPEQARGNVAALDQRTDVYALGAILRTILKGHRRMALDAVAAKAMAPEPLDRYQSVEALTRDVRAFVGGFAVSVQSVGIGTLIWLLVKRHKGASATAAVSLVAIAVLLSVFFVKLTQSEGRALNALQLSTQSERRALETLERLRAEEAEKMRIGRYATAQLFGHAEELARNVSFEDALNEVNLVVVLDSTMAQAWTLKGFLHLGRQEFDAALTSFERIPSQARRVKRTPPLRFSELAEKYRELLPTPGSLPFPRMHELIADLTNPAHAIPAPLHETAIGQLFQHLNESGMMDPDHINFLRESMAVFNPPGTNIVFDYHVETAGLNLTIRGGQIQKLIPLTGLPIHALNLSQTAVKDLRWLRRSGLGELNLAGTPITDLTPISNLPLKKLNVKNCPNLRIDQLRPFQDLETVIVAAPLVEGVQKQFASRRSPPEVLTE